jgi:hypothetical protein
MNAAEGADGEGGVKGGGEALAADVAEVQAKGAVGEGEIIEEVAADFRDGLKFVRDGNGSGAQGLAREHKTLYAAGFLEVQFPGALESRKLR